MRIEIMINKEQKISPETLSALEAELYKNFLPIYPDTSIRIRKGSANGVVLSGVRQDDDKRMLWISCRQYGKTTAGSTSTDNVAGDKIFSGAGKVEQRALRGVRLCLVINISTKNGCLGLPGRLRSSSRRIMFIFSCPIVR